MAPMPLLSSSLPLISVPSFTPCPNPGRATHRQRSGTPAALPRGAGSTPRVPHPVLRLRRLRAGQQAPDEGKWQEPTTKDVEGALRDTVGRAQEGLADAGTAIHDAVGLGGAHANDAADELRKQGRSGADTAREGAKDVQEDSKSLGEPLLKGVERVRDSVADSGRSVADTAAGTAENVQEGAENAQERAKGAADAVGKWAQGLELVRAPFPDWSWMPLQMGATLVLAGAIMLTGVGSSEAAAPDSASARGGLQASIEDDLRWDVIATAKQHALGDSARLLVEVDGGNKVADVAGLFDSGKRETQKVVDNSRVKAEETARDVKGISSDPAGKLLRGIRETQGKGLDVVEGVKGKAQNAGDVVKNAIESRGKDLTSALPFSVNGPFTVAELPGQGVSSLAPVGGGEEQPKKGGGESLTETLRRDTEGVINKLKGKVQETNLEGPQELAKQLGSGLTLPDLGKEADGTESGAYESAENLGQEESKSATTNGAFEPGRLLEQEKKGNIL